MTEIRRPVEHGSFAESERRYLALVDASSDGIVVHDGSHVLFANRATAAIVGASRSSELTGMPITMFVRDHDRVALDEMRAYLAEDPSRSREMRLRLRRLTGDIVPVDATFSLVSWYGQSAVQVVMHDVRTAQRAAQTEAVRQQLEQAVTEAVICMDASFRITSWNSAAERLYGWAAEEVIGRRIGDIVGAALDTTIREDVLSSLFRGGSWRGRSRQTHRDGRIIEMDTHATVFRDDNGDVAGMVSINRAVNGADGSEHGTLTGLTSRAHLMEIFACSPRTHPTVVLLIDLDHFSEFNAKMGMAAGDQVLVELAHRLRDVVRAGDVVAHVAGDRFAVYGAVLGAADARALATRLHRLVGEPIDVGGTLVSLSASAGAAWDAGGAAPERLFEQSERALREAEARGGRQMCFYGPSTEAGGWDDDQRFISDVRAAMASGEMFLAYQPIVELGSSRIRKVEALARWQHPERGSIPPSHFISLAERSGAIIDLGYWVLRQACADAVLMADGRDDLGLCVNLSAAQLRDARLPERVAGVLRETGWRAANLWLEVTESVLVDDGALAPLQRLHDLGVRLVIDDFGTGFASLQYLTRLPVDALKIDRGFVAGLGVDAGDTAIVRSVVNLGRELGLHVVAEGVETESQRAQLVALNCRLAQGWLFGYPLPVAEMVASLRPDRLVDGIAPASTAPIDAMRRDALQASRILDTSPEAAYDSLAQLAASALDMPIALIAFTDADRQWFKAKVGIDLDEVPRSLSFCEHVLDDEATVFVVEDAAADPRFATSPFVTGELAIRFYAGAAIRSREGFTVGSVSVLDRRPRTMTPEQVSMLQLLAEQAAALVDLRRRASELTDLDEVGAEDPLSRQRPAPIQSRSATSRRSSPARPSSSGPPISCCCSTATARSASPTRPARRCSDTSPPTGSARAASTSSIPTTSPTPCAPCRTPRSTNGSHRPHELRVLRADGSWCHMEVVAHTLLGVPGIDGIILTARDVSDHRAASTRISQQREFIDSTLDNLTDAVVACDENGVLTVFNQAARKLHDLAGRPIAAPDWSESYDLYSADGSERLTTEKIPLFRALHGERIVDEEITIAPAGRARRLVRCNGQQLRDPSGNVIGAVIAMRDITSQREVESLLRHQALHDQLTGLANRHQVIPHLDDLVRADPTAVTVAFVDLDRLKAVNDHHGHRAGDHLIFVLAQRLLAVSSRSDMVARIGGDEFVIVPHRDSRGGAFDEREYMQRLRDATSFTTMYDGKVFDVSASCGIVHGRFGDTSSSILSRADEAMYAVKQRRPAS